MSAAIKPTAGPMVVDTNTPELPFRVYSLTTQGNIGFFLAEADAQRFAAHEALVEALQQIAKSSQAEFGCYYTNLRNISAAKQALAAAGVKP